MKCGYDVFGSLEVHKVFDWDISQTGLPGPPDLHLQHRHQI